MTMKMMAMAVTVTVIMMPLIIIVEMMIIMLEVNSYDEKRESIDGDEHRHVGYHVGGDKRVKMVNTMNERMIMKII